MDNSSNNSVHKCYAIQTITEKHPRKWKIELEKIDISDYEQALFTGVLSTRQCDNLKTTGTTHLRPHSETKGPSRSASGIGDKGDRLFFPIWNKMSHDKVLPSS